MKKISISKPFASLVLSVFLSTLCPFAAQTSSAGGCELKFSVENKDGIPGGIASFNRFKAVYKKYNGAQSEGDDSVVTSPHGDTGRSSESQSDNLTGPTKIEVGVRSVEGKWINTESNFYYKGVVAFKNCPNSNSVDIIMISTKNGKTTEKKFATAYIPLASKQTYVYVRSFTSKYDINAWVYPVK